MAKILYTDGGTAEIENDELTLEFMQKVVKGYIQIVYATNGQLIICNEEGKILGLPVNQKATDMYRNDIILGDVIIANKNEID